MPDAIATALKNGNGKALAEALARKKKPELVKPIAQKVDVSRWDKKFGKALLGAADWILEQQDDHVRDFLPCLAIATARAFHGGDRERADVVLAKLRPYVERSEQLADMVARSGCHFISAHQSADEATTMHELALAHPGIKKNAYFIKLEKLIVEVM